MTLIGHFGGLTPQSLLQPYGSALTATFDKPLRGRYYCMTVIYERNMTIIYDIALNPIEWAKVSYELHTKGLSLVSKYVWSVKVDSENYGKQEVTTEDTKHIISIDGVDAITCRFVTDAEKIETQLLDNTNYDIELRQIRSSSSETKWINPPGSHFIMEFDNLVGKQQIAVVPELVYVIDSFGPYQECVFMQTRLSNINNTEVQLNFKILWSTDGVQTKGAIEEMCVNTPLDDMGAIQYHVEQALMAFSVIPEPLIECYFDAKTESRSECAPDIIAKTREAKSKIAEGEDE